MTLPPVFILKSVSPDRFKLIYFLPLPGFFISTTHLPDQQKKCLLPMTIFYSLLSHFQSMNTFYKVKSELLNHIQNVPQPLFSALSLTIKTNNYTSEGHTFNIHSKTSPCTPNTIPCSKITKH